jgi:hypothetical protein
LRAVFELKVLRDPAGNDGFDALQPANFREFKKVLSVLRFDQRRGIQKDRIL